MGLKHINAYNRDMFEHLKSGNGIFQVLFIVTLGVYPPITSFSDPKGITQTVTMFHIKTEFLC